MLRVLAPKGPNKIAQGKRRGIAASDALGKRDTPAKALKGRNIFIAVSPFQGSIQPATVTQGGAPRLRRLALPWAGLFSPFGATGVPSMVA